MSGSLARLSVTGAVGSVWTIQFQNSLAGTNTWLPLATVSLSNNPTAMVDTTGPAAGTRFYRAVSAQPPSNVVTTNMVWIWPGSFVMGSPANEPGRQPDETQHLVTLTKGFYIGKYLVTQGDFMAVVGYNPSWFYQTNGRVDYGTNFSRPVEQVSWYYAATYYCSLLTTQEQQAGRLPAGWAYRLPTEAEWEYACRAGTTNRFSFGDDPTFANLGNYAWYAANSAGRTQPVGQKLPNPWGLYDMHGDVYEWCQDWYDDYPPGPAVDPQGPAGGYFRVFRGGSWYYGGQNCRSAGRYWSDPAWTDKDIGFRVVAAPAL